MKWLAKKTRH